MANYFLPSFFQKRLLRYALSRFELIDTEALDLDNLGIRWGQRSTIELRDVGLKLTKLTSLLHLPPSCELLRARITLLRVTIPADIYSSGISFEVDGVNVHLRLLSEVESQGGNPKGTNDDAPLPTATDLAQSFLESEPTEEREELQAVITSQSQHLQRASSSVSDEEEELGLGEEGVSLPSFIASFLKGVVDRLQLRIKDVSVRVDMDLRQDGPVKRYPEDKPDPVSVMLTVQEILMDGVAPSSAQDTSSLKAGGRSLTLAAIQGILLSDSIVFANYSRFAVPSSLSTTQSRGTAASGPSEPISPQPPSPAESFRPTIDMSRSTILGYSQASDVGESFHSGSQSAVLRSSLHPVRDGSSAPGQDTEYDDDPDPDYHSLSGSGNESRILDNPAYLDEVFHSQYMDDELESSHMFDTSYSPPNRDTPRAHSPELAFADAETSHHFHDPPSPPLQSATSQVDYPSEEVHLRTDNVPPVASEAPANAQVETSTASLPRPPHDHNQHSSNSSPQSRRRTDSPTEDLSESKIFSHEEAESMYLSAISHGSGISDGGIPGAWGSPPLQARMGAQIDTSVSTTLPADDGQQLHSEILGDARSTTPTPRNPGSHEEREETTMERSHHTLAGTEPGAEYDVDPEERRPATRSSDAQTEQETALKIIDIDKVAIWIPSEGQVEQPQPEENIPPGLKTMSSDLKYSTVSLTSTVANDLGVSKYETLSKNRRDSIESGAAYDDSDKSPPTLRREAQPTHPKAISVDVSSVALRLDLASGWLLTKVSQRLQTVQQPDQKPRPAASGQAKQISISQKYSFTVKSLSIKLLERLVGISHAAEPPSSSPSFSNIASTEEVILQASISNAKAGLALGGVNTDLQLDLSRLSVGLGSGDLLSFNNDLKMRESTRDIPTPVQHDISLSINKSGNVARVDLKTLPIHLNINIQRLDETLMWLGGLSTILELGSSIASVSTVRGGQPDAKKPSRGVHFEASSPGPKTVASGSEAAVNWKVNARFGGVLFDLVGGSCAAQFKSTAVKVVSRYEGIGVQIDKAKLSGPYLPKDTSEVPASISMDNIRIEYLFSPKEVDLDRLLSLITPSKDKYEEDDDIMIDTLFRQRRQGAVLRVTVGSATVDLSSIDELRPLSTLLDEASKLSTVTKYLPEDDRPGILTLALIRELDAQVFVGEKVGDLRISAQDIQAAHVSIPSLVAAQITKVQLKRNGIEELVGIALEPSQDVTLLHSPAPMVMARYIAEEMEPTVKIKLHNFRFEYTIPSLMAFLDMGSDTTAEDLAASMANSVINLADIRVPSHLSMDATSLSTEGPESPQVDHVPFKLTVALRDCVIGLNPREMPAKGLLIFTYARFSGAIPKDGQSQATLDVKRASVMIIDDVQNIDAVDNTRHRRDLATGHGEQVRAFAGKGFVPISFISSALVVIKVVQLDHNGEKSLDVEVRDDLLILETCADSTQTMINLMNGLKPPTPPSIAIKYRTEIMPLQDMLASFSGDAFVTEQLLDAEGTLSPSSESPAGLGANDDRPDEELEYVSDFYPPQPEDTQGALGTSMAGSQQNMLNSFHSAYQVSSSIGDLEFQDDHFAQKSSVGGTAHRWDSTQNTYDLANDGKLYGSPLRVRVRDVHFIWYLFDGYDWRRTRDTIAKAVRDVELKATERRAKATSRLALEEEDEESVIGDFLFNSIYIGIPANKDPRDLSNEINRNIDDLVSETGSYTTSTTMTAMTTRPGSSTGRGKKLRLSRSKHHKMNFELKGICADIVVFPPEAGETQSSVDIRVDNLEIFDNIPTSTWKKFATYMYDAGERESGTSMVHIEILNVKPVVDLAASEIVLKATVLPLRLHVDQDALDFMSRFFEFKDESVPASSTPGDTPFLQRVEVNAIRVKLDFKPKRVDYGGLRSGRTTEFMNFFVLDEADMVLRRVIIYGVSGFDKLGLTLNDIWMPDVKRNQLPGVLAGLAPIRSLVNVTSGVKDLVVIPMREYKKDGRIVRSIQKGALAFAKTTTNELVKLGAKLAIGTQTVLQGAEGLLSPTSQDPPPGYQTGYSGDSDSGDEEEKKQISLYADQPVGVVQGLRGAFTSLERDLLMARDAIVAVPGEVLESGSATGAAQAVLRRAPTVILRPAIGATKAVGQTLLGAGNSLDPKNRRRVEDKYKRHQI